MKKILILVILLLASLSYSQTKVPTDRIPEITSDMLSNDLINDIQNGSGGSSTGNTAIIVCTTLAEITSAGANSNIEVRTEITATSNFQFPVGQYVTYAVDGSIDMGAYTVDWNGTTQKPYGTNLAVNLSLGTSEGDVVWDAEKVELSNIGGVDDGVFDNWKVVKNGLQIVNQNSGHLYFNRQTATARYYLQIYDNKDISPFFVNGADNGRTLLVGNGFDNVEISSQTGVEIKTYAENLPTSVLFKLYNTANSKIYNNTFIGDRFEHFYDEKLVITTGATQNGSVHLNIREYNDFQNSYRDGEIDVDIPLTLSDLDTNVQEISDFINTNAALSNYSVLNVEDDDGDKIITLRTVAGQYTDVFFTDLDSGAGVTRSPQYFEWGHCITQGSRSVNCEIVNNTIKWFHGDAISKSEQGNGTASIDPDELNTGIVDEDGNIDIADTDFLHSNIIDLPSPHEWFIFMNGAYTSVILTHFRYWVAFYDENDVFMEKSPQLKPFMTYNYEGKGFKKYRVILDKMNTSELNGFRWFMNSPSMPSGGRIAHNKFIENRRHAVTNVLDYQIVENNYFYRNSGISPQIDLNIEDWGKRVKGQVIRYNTFEIANVANISLKGADYVEIYGNKFIRGAHSFPNTSWDKLSTCITTSYARYSKIHTNYYEGKDTSVDIMSTSYNNQYLNSKLTMRNGSPKIYNEMFVNSTVGDGASGNDLGQGLGGAGTPQFENSNFYINESWGNKAFVDEANTITHKNIKYFFNDKVTNHKVISDPSLRTVELRGTSYNYVRADRATADNGEHEGSYDGTYVYGLKATASQQQYIGWKQYACENINFEQSGSLHIENGYAKDFLMKNGKVNGWLWLELAEFPTDGVGDFYNVTIENVDIIIPEEVDSNEGYLKNNKYGGGTTLQNLIRITENLNINLTLKNCKFIRKDSTIGLSGYFGHRGSLTFNDCVWDFATAETINFTSTGSDTTIGVYASPTLGNVTNINPTVLNSNTSFIYKGSDTGEI